MQGLMLMVKIGPNCVFQLFHVCKALPCSLILNFGKCGADFRINLQQEESYNCWLSMAKIEYNGQATPIFSAWWQSLDMNNCWSGINFWTNQPGPGIGSSLKSSYQPCPGEGSSLKFSRQPEPGLGSCLKLSHQPGLGIGSKLDFGWYGASIYQVVLDFYEEPWGPVRVSQQKGTLGLLLVCFLQKIQVLVLEIRLASG